MRDRIPIILIGMKHCGKTTLGRSLARRWNAPFWDLDDLLLELAEAPAGSSARAVYSARGEAGFRSLEAEAAAELARRLEADRNAVAALGGGTVSNRSAMEALERTGLIVYLEEAPEILFARIRRGGIPPFLSPGDPYGSFLQLFEERARICRTRADIILPLQGAGPQEALRLLEESIEEQAYGR